MNESGIFPTLDFQEFSIQLGYFYKYLERTFSGRVRFHDDGKLVGLISNTTQDIDTNYRDGSSGNIIIGKFKGNKINFLKISSDSHKLPEVYSTSLINSRYVGKWDFFLPPENLVYGFNKKIAIFPELETAFKLTNYQQALDVLSGIEITRVERYLTPELTYNLRRNHLAYLSLTLTPAK